MSTNSSKITRLTLEQAIDSGVLTNLDRVRLLDPFEDGVIQWLDLELITIQNQIEILVNFKDCENSLLFSVFQPSREFYYSLLDGSIQKVFEV